MTLEGQFGVVYNLKRIRRIMKKYNIICPIRKANPYRKMMKATREHTVVPNLSQVHDLLYKMFYNVFDLGLIVGGTPNNFHSKLNMLLERTQPLFMDIYENSSN